MFECNICLDTARDAVVKTRPNRQVCPVCKASISKEKVVPLYGRGSTKQEDPREKVPPDRQVKELNLNLGQVFQLLDLATTASTCLLVLELFLLDFSHQLSTSENQDQVPPHAELSNTWRNNFYPKYFFGWQFFSLPG
ncbi:hypothetical protein NQ317_016615 [Molorchus minor]|uniref:RING-type E3 ubiquitin transferase n=1 Tax=Molorchus minor TaxID=1323400 RepID=A0ABQ9IRC2_9CUCU|nr:hypothetical protein NQ317_016615 [Molorchus minor]